MTVDPNTVDPAKSHPSSNMGHELSDFSWSTVLWLIPLSVMALTVFVLISLYWFRGAKDSEHAAKQGFIDISELQALRSYEDSVLGQYKWLDKEKGKVRLPIERAMELVVREGQASFGMGYRPITEIYLEGAAFSEGMQGSKAFDPPAVPVPDAAAHDSVSRAPATTAPSHGGH